MGCFNKPKKGRRRSSSATPRGEAIAKPEASEEESSANKAADAAVTPQKEVKKLSPEEEAALAAKRAAKAARLAAETKAINELIRRKSQKGAGSGDPPQNKDKAAASPRSQTLSLPGVTPEAEAMQEAFGGPSHAEVAVNTSVSMLDGALRGRKTWIFCGHADAPLAGESVLAFMDTAGGGQESVSIDTLVGIVKPHVLRGRLQLIVLTGCKTLALAQALRERAFVPYVLCWETLLLDEVASIFGRAFAEATASGHPPQRAYDSACRAVTTVTEPGYLDSGVSAAVQKYELHVDPLDYELVYPSHPLTIRSGRLRKHAPLAVKGRLAVGKPRLLLPDDTKLHGVPALPAHWVPRPEQRELRAVLVGGSLSEYSSMANAILDVVTLEEGEQQRAVDLRGLLAGLMGGGSSEQGRRHDHLAFAGLTGAAGLGKSALASWLCHDTVTRTAYRDGCFWLEFGRNRSGFELMGRLAKLLDVPHREVGELRRQGSGSDIVDAVTDIVATRLRGKHCLIVLDDVWDEQQPRPFARLAGQTVTVLLTTRRSQIVESYGVELRPRLRPIEAGAARRLLVAESGKQPAELAQDAANSRAVDSLVKLCAGLPAMLRSVGRMCSNRSPEGTIQFFETHRVSQRLPRTMARSDGYQIEAAGGNIFVALEGQAKAMAAVDPSLAEKLAVLAVFDAGVRVPLHVLMGLWGEGRGRKGAAAVAQGGGGVQQPGGDEGKPMMDEAEAREVIERLAAEHFVELAPVYASSASSSRNASPAPSSRRLNGGRGHGGRGRRPPPRRLDGGSTSPAGSSPTSTARSPISSSPISSVRAHSPSPLSGHMSPASMRGTSSDGKVIELTAPVSMFLTCRAGATLASMHTRLLTSCRASSIDQSQSFWTPTNFLQHLGAARAGRGTTLAAGALASITRINLGSAAGRTIGAGGLSSLTSALSKPALTNLTELQLDRNALGDPGALALAESVDGGAFEKLTHLGLSSNAIGDVGLAALASRAGAGQMPMLITLDLSHNAIGDDGLLALAAAVRKGVFSACTTLNLSSNQIGDAGVNHLVGSLKSNADHRASSLDEDSTVSPTMPNLVSLLLNENRFGDPGITTLALACSEGLLSANTLGLSKLGRQRLGQMVRMGLGEAAARFAPPGSEPPPPTGAAAPFAPFRRRGSMRGRRSKKMVTT